MGWVCGDIALVDLVGPMMVTDVFPDRWKCNLSEIAPFDEASRNNTNNRLVVSWSKSNSWLEFSR